ncbi:MAG TPA: tripartite tricarboxylate transporter substrate binding protein [Thermodesulfobacteriota bacterium]|nr:tripartite tricarboxylate transporter substrate binding protein [Thermodesulfobacteriota bacterium]
MKHARPFLILTLVILAIAVLPSKAPAEYPEKEITVIVPWAAGGGTDLIARFLGDLMEKNLGKPVVVVNKPGGGGLVGFNQIAAAKPDGYTIGVNTNSQILQRWSASSYLDWRELAPIALHNNDPAGFTVKADAPWKNIKEALDYAKANPLKVRVGNSGPGAIWHVAAAMLGSKAGVQFTHVPYGGANPAAVAVAGGHIEATSVSPAEVGTLIRGGKLRLLAIASDKRDPLFPDVPTFKESGIDFSFGVWRCLVAPKNTPKEIIARLETAVKAAVNDPKFKEFMTKNGFGQAYMGPAEAAALMAQNEKEFEKVVPGLGLKKN